jgi:hypothetical protein
VESELPTQTHVLNREQDFSDPRSLRKTNFSALIEQIVNLNKEQKRQIYDFLKPLQSNDSINTQLQQYKKIRVFCAVRRYQQ